VHCELILVDACMLNRVVNQSEFLANKMRKCVCVSPVKDGSPGEGKDREGREGMES